MPRLRLRHCEIRFIDGYAGVATVNGAPADAAVTMNIIFTAGLIPVGTRFTVAGANQIYTIVEVVGSPDTTGITFSPPLSVADGLPEDGAVMTIQGRFMEIKVGDGGITYDTARTIEYELDRGQIDGAVEGDDTPVTVNLNLTYEFLKALTGAVIPTPKDVLKKRGAAADWVTAGADPCEPFAVLIEIDYHPPCDLGHEITHLPEFRAESINHDLKAATLAVRGQCKVKDIVPFRRAY